MPATIVIPTDELIHTPESPICGDLDCPCWGQIPAYEVDLTDDEGDLTDYEVKPRSVRVQDERGVDIRISEEPWEYGIHCQIQGLDLTEAQHEALSRAAMLWKYGVREVRDDVPPRSLERKMLDLIRRRLHGD